LEHELKGQLGERCVLQGVMYQECSVSRSSDM
jgi:hypothetical protein